MDKSYDAKDTYEYLAPVIDTDVFTAWLTKLVQQKGAKMLARTIKGDIFDQEDELRDTYGEDITTNTTAPGATEPAGDTSCYPIPVAVSCALSTTNGISKNRATR